MPHPHRALLAGTLGVVTEFLSREWLAALDAVARQSDRLAALALDTTFVIEQRVSGGPDGEVTYQVVIGRDGASVVPGSESAPDIVLSTDYGTALALHRGEANAQSAVAEGRIKLRGEVGSLFGRGDALNALDDVFAAVRAGTTVSAPGSGGHR
jgi:hypothetical protein